MKHHHPNKAEGAKPLRRSDLRAMVTHLAEKERTARIIENHRKTRGKLGAMARNGTLTFGAEPSPEGPPVLPVAGAQVTLLFRLRGLSFRAEGGVVRADADKGRLLVRPEFIEWTAEGLRLEGARYHRSRAVLVVRGPGQRSLRLGVLALTQQELYFVCWPCPAELDRKLGSQGVLEHEGRKQANIDFIVSGSTPVYPGCHGRIVRASVGDGANDLRTLLDRLESAVDRRRHAV
jgi:hypothetical protein